METLMTIVLMLIGGTAIYCFFIAVFQWWEEFVKSAFGDNERND
jgi:hypothetical protein